jgi:hypothetical protein
MAASARAATVVATGDSQSAAYGDRLQAMLTRLGVDASALKLASGGATSKVYAGVDVDLATTPPRAHDFATDAIELQANLVLFMLGTNDALQSDDWFPQYQTLISGAFDRLDAAGVRVVIGSNLPILPFDGYPRYAVGDERLRTLYHPWLQAQAAQRGYVYLDNYSAIQQQPNWQSWYSDNGLTPGYVHLYWRAPDGSRPGYDWLAERMARGVAQAYAGDANLDGVVDGADYTAWADHLQQAGKFRDGDFNCDGIIDGADYTLWADHFNSAAAGALPVPEPSSGMLGTLAALLIAARCRARRRQPASAC